MAVERIGAGVNARRAIQVAVSPAVSLWKRFYGIDGREARAVRLVYEEKARERRVRVAQAEAREEETVERARHLSSAVRDSAEPLTFEEFVGMVGSPPRPTEEEDNGTDDA